LLDHDAAEMCIDQALSTFDTASNSSASVMRALRVRRVNGLFLNIRTRPSPSHSVR
jgi:hypothetical protein